MTFLFKDLFTISDGDAQTAMSILGRGNEIIMPYTSSSRLEEYIQPEPPEDGSAVKFPSPAYTSYEQHTVFTLDSLL
jgi:hypothetical protein